VAQEARPVGSWLFRSSVGSSGSTSAGTPRFEAPGAAAVERGRASWYEAAAADLVTLFASSDVERYDEHPGGGLRLEHQTASARFELPMLDESRLSIFADLGFGATRLQSHEPGQFQDGRGNSSYDTYLSGMGGLTVQYRLTPDVRAYVGARYFEYFSEADGLALNEAPDAERLLESSSWTFPITVGIRVSFD
jgi:hypothetical protein